MTDEEILMDWQTMYCALRHTAMSHAMHYASNAPDRDDPEKVSRKDYMLGIKYVYVYHKKLITKEYFDFVKHELQSGSEGEDYTYSDQWTESEHKDCQICYDMNNIHKNWSYIPRIDNDVPVMYFYDNAEKIEKELESN